MPERSWLDPRYTQDPVPCFAHRWPAPQTLHLLLGALHFLPEASAQAAKGGHTQVSTSCSCLDPLGHSHLETGACRPRPLTSPGLTYCRGRCPAAR